MVGLSESAWWKQLDESCENESEPSPSVGPLAWVTVSDLAACPAQ